MNQIDTVVSPGAEYDSDLTGVSISTFKEAAVERNSEAAKKVINGLMKSVDQEWEDKDMPEKLERYIRALYVFMLEVANELEEGFIYAHPECWEELGLIASEGST